MGPTKTEFDFVVVGGGTAGLVVAARLTENPNISVLVLEAGNNALQDPRISIPALWSAILGTELDWDFVTTPQEHMNGRQIGQPQGRLLGGSSGLNAEVFVPPSAVGFDAWEAIGNPGWAWKDVMSYFKKFHTLRRPDDELREHLEVNWIDSSAPEASGPVQASFTDTTANPLGKAWVDTFKTLGAGLTTDPFMGGATGGFSCPASVDPATKTRSYSASAYYAPVAERSNLEVITGATANKVLFEGASDDGSPVARAVVFKDKDGHEHRVRAIREVILAAGAFQTPKLLEVSGIGDKSLLEKFNIPCLVHSPGVGENLQDHIMTGASFEVADGIMTGDCLLRREPGMFEAFMQMYQEHKAGPLASGALMSYAFMPILSAEIDKLDPSATSGLEQALKDLQDNLSGMTATQRSHAKFITRLLKDPSHASGALFGIPAQVNLHNGPRQIGMTTDPVDGNYLSMGAALIHPLSRGSSHITSGNVDDPPVIDPRYLSHPLDIEIYARHLMAVEVLSRTEPMASFLKPDGRRAQPGPNGARFDTVDKAKDYIRATALSNNHPVGTCAMLPQDKGGVVDANLNAYGVKGLRIADSSIMPFLPRSNTQTTVYTVAEKAADLIKSTHGI
ncbi:unnamed protein product [Discula destructiva]